MLKCLVGYMRALFITLAGSEWMSLGYLCNVAQIISMGEQGGLE